MLILSSNCVSKSITTSGKHAHARTLTPKPKLPVDLQLTVMFCI